MGKRKLSPLALIFDSFKECAIGFNDSGDFFTLWIGGRGTGSMIESCSHAKLVSEAADLDAAAADFLAQLKKGGYIVDE
jgi:hypothetical protein